LLVLLVVLVVGRQLETAGGTGVMHFKPLDEAEKVEIVSARHLNDFVLLLLIFSLRSVL